MTTTTQQAPSRPAGARPGSAAVLAALAVVYVVWGSTYVAMRIGVRDLPPLTLSAVRFAVAGAALFAWCAWRRRRATAHPRTRADQTCVNWRRPSWRQWRAGAVQGLLLPAAGTGGATWAEQRLPAGTTALLLASIPLWMVLFSWMSTRDQVGRRVVAALALGVVGVAVLVDPFSSSAPPLAPTLVALGGAMSWAVGSVRARHADRPEQPLLASAVEMLCAGAALLAVAAATGELGRVRLDAAAGPSLAALLYLIVFGSLTAYSSYEWLLQHTPARVAGTYAFVNPLVAVVLGWWLLGETVTWRTAASATMIIIAVGLIVVRRSAARR